MKKILFIQYGVFSHINDSLQQQFKLQFPEYELEVYNVIDYIKSLRIKRIFSLFYACIYHGKDILQRRKSYYDIITWEIYTPYINKQLKQAITSKVRSSNDYIFTFQTQSISDCSTGIIPHFLYTDSTVLSLLQNPDSSIETLPYKKKWLKLEKEFYANAHHCFTFSTNQEKSIVEQYNVEKKHVTCVYAGSNIQIPQPNSEKIYNNKILFVGVNWERKGGPVLLRAFNKVRKEIPEAELYIVGISRDYILQFESEELLQNCYCLGRLPSEQVAQYYADCSVFCMPTRNEPFGIVFVEAIYYNLPIVSSNIGAIPDMVIHNKTGFLHHPDDVDGIATSILQLLHDKKVLHDFAFGAKNLIADRYTWENVVGKMKTLIKSYIKE